MESQPDAPIKPTMLDRLYAAILRFVFRRMKKSGDTAKIFANNILSMFETLLLVAAAYWFSVLTDIEIPKLLFLLVPLGFVYYNTGRYEFLDFKQFRFRDPEMSLRRGDKLVMGGVVAFIVGTFAYTIIKKVAL